MRMPRTAHVSLLLLGASLLCAQNAREISPALAYSSTRLNFQKQVQTLHEQARGPDKSFNPVDINLVLGSVKSEILEHTPKKDLPLHMYVEQNFPEKVNESDGQVPEEKGESILGRVMDLLDRITRQSDFSVDLKVKSRPQGARFEIKFRNDSPFTTATDGTITNIYRGRYVYRLSKTGYKDIQEPIDFIERSGDILDCELIPSGSAQTSLPCKLR